MRYLLVGNVVGYQCTVVGAKAIGQLTLGDIAHGQCLLTQFLLLLTGLRFVYGAARERVRLERTVLEFGVEEQAWWTGLRPCLPIAAQIELATIARIGEEAVRFGTLEWFTGSIVGRVLVVRWLGRRRGGRLTIGASAR